MNRSINELMLLERTALLADWQKVFGTPAPSLSRDNFLRRALGWQMQIAQHGKLSSAELKSLKGSQSKTDQALTPSSQLIRVWQGETHQVIVLEKGFSYKNKRWKSLTAITKAITGTAWSGPVFFGLKK